MHRDQSTVERAGVVIQASTKKPFSVFTIGSCIFLRLPLPARRPRGDMAYKRPFEACQRSPKRGWDRLGHSADGSREGGVRGAWRRESEGCGLTRLCRVPAAPSFPARMNSGQDRRDAVLQGLTVSRSDDLMHKSPSDSCHRIGALVHHLYVCSTRVSFPSSYAYSG